MGAQNPPHGTRSHRFSKKVAMQNLQDALQWVLAPGERILVKTEVSKVSEEHDRKGYLVLSTERLFFMGETRDHKGFELDRDANWNLKAIRVTYADYASWPWAVHISGSAFYGTKPLAPEIQNALALAVQAATPPPSPPPSTQPPVVVTHEVIKEIVKVPCRYCGQLNLITDTKCASCGAGVR
jgi:hypothetical protein